MPGISTRALLRELSVRSYAPYSNRRDAAVVLLPDGSYVPGVRLESASFSLVLPAVVNAVTTAVALGITEIAAVITAEPATDEDVAYMAASPWGPLRRMDEHTFTLEAAWDLPEPDHERDPFLPRQAPEPVADGIRLARDVSRRAHVPESHFPVGCVAELEDGHVIPGVNVEHPDWGRILCAERNAVGTVVSYGLAPIRRLFLTCTRDASCSPCGACRQILTEQASGAAIIMDRTPGEALILTPAELLPHHFAGETLTQNPGNIAARA